MAAAAVEVPGTVVVPMGHLLAVVLVLVLLVQQMEMVALTVVETAEAAAVEAVAVPLAAEAVLV